jgi:hypothetical protein
LELESSDEDFVKLSAVRLKDVNVDEVGFVEEEGFVEDDGTVFVDDTAGLVDEAPSEHEAGAEGFGQQYWGKS